MRHVELVAARGARAAPKARGSWIGRRRAWFLDRQPGGGSVEQELETIAGAGAEQLLGVSIDVSIVA